MSMAVVVFLFITAITLGPILIIFGYLYMRRRAINKEELQALRRELSQIRSDIEDIKVQIAEFIIKTH